MPRSIWKGHITFGLVNVPITLFSGERKVDLHFNLIDGRNNAKVRYERVNEETGDEVPWNKIVKGYEYEGGQYVLLNNEDFDNVRVEGSKTIEIEEFVERTAVPPMYFEKPYVLVPGKKGEKGYALLRKTLEQTDKIGIARVVIRSRQHLAALMPVQEHLILNVLRFQQELADLETIDVGTDDVSVSAKEIQMATQLVEAMVTDWEPKKYHDEYREALLKFIDSKVEKGDMKAIAEEEEEVETTDTKVVDMMALLKKSIDSKEKPNSKPAKVKRATTTASKSKAKPKAKGKAKPAKKVARGA